MQRQVGDHFIQSKQVRQCLRRCWWLVAIELFCAIIALGQYRFDSWTTDNGLPQNSINAITQTRDGYLWLATLNGLARFDGVHFTVFDRSNSKTMASNRCTALLEDADGTLWVGTEDSGLMRYQAGRFSRVLDVGDLPHYRIFALQRESDGGILISTTGGQVTWREGHKVTQPADLRRFIGSSGTQWLLRNTEAQRIPPGQSSQTLRLPYPSPLSLQQLMNLRLFEDRRGDLWIGAPDWGIARIGSDGGSIHFSEKDGIPKIESFEAIANDADGAVWFVSRRQGAVCFQQGRFSVYTPTEGLPSLFISALFKDREGTLWMGTTNRGLVRVSRRFISVYSVSDGLVDPNVHPIMQDRGGRVWIGTADGLSVFHDGHFTNYKKQNWLQRKSVQSLYVQSLYEDDQGRIWIGLARGLLRFESNRFVDETELVGNLTVPAICRDRAGAMWFGTQNGLFKSDGVTIEHFTTERGLPHNDVKVIHEDRHGALWVGTYGGLVQFRDGKLAVYTERDGLAGNRVRSIYEDDEGVLWIGTYDDGLSRFKDGRFVSFKIENGLYNNGVFQILEDAHGYFWMSSNRGIHRVAKQQLNEFAAARIAKLESFAYGKQDGMLTIECNGGRQPGGYKTRDGRLWFPTQDGVVVIDPDAVPFNPSPPPVHIESVVLDRADVPFQNGVMVRPAQANLEINYTGLSFIHADQVRFKYKLIGQDKDWIEAGTRRVAYYPYLPPGSYTFMVIAANSDGVWNTQGQSLTVTVLPPFYRTWWFLALSLLGIVGVVTAAIGYRLNQLHRKNEDQRAFSRQLIDSQEAERKRIAAELHDSLGQSLLIIKNRAYLGAAQPDDARNAQEQLHEISEASADAIHQVREIAYYLRPSQLDRLGLTSSLEEMLEQVAGSASLLFDVTLAPLDGFFAPEEEINFYRIVQECLNNIVKHSRATAAEISVRCEAGFVKLTIRDNGQGFSPQANPPSAHNPRSGGFGLTGIAERVRMLGGKHTIQSAPGQGTTVQIQIPIKGKSNADH